MYGTILRDESPYVLETWWDGGWCLCVKPKKAGKLLGGATPQMEIFCKKGRHDGHNNNMAIKMEGSQ
jgi:hypothetical protein